MSADDSTQPTLWDTGGPLKRCNKCGKVKPLSEFYIHNKRGRPVRKHTCTPCLLKEQKAFRRAYFEKHGRNPPRDQRNHSLKKLYGISTEDYARMVEEQGGLCAICAQPPVGGRGYKLLHVDHDHATGKIRQLLCGRCNTMIGQAKENPAILLAAAEYLQKHQSD